MPPQDQLNDLNRLIGELIANVQDLQKAVTSLEKDVAELNNVASRWKGAFSLVLVFGAVVTWVINLLPPLWERN